MKISSTEFQQRVGYYLSLVEKGMEVIIERGKPGKSLFMVSLRVPDSQKEDLAKRKEFLKEFRSIPARFDAKDCIDFQRRVRQ